MLLGEEDEPALKTWLEQRLSKISDAEAPILAEYCIALLKHDQSETQVYDLCVEQLSDFLRGDTKKFVGDVFKAIKERSFIKGGSLNVRQPVSTIQEIKTILPTPKPKPISRESIAVPKATNVLQYPPMPLPPQGMIPDPAFLQYIQQSQPISRKRKHCFAFEQKGFCNRGAACPYEHKSSQPVRNLHEYDPNFSAMSNGVQSSQQPYVRSTYQDTMQSQPQTKERQTSARKEDNKQRGPEHDKSRTTLVVDNIPQENLHENSVRAFFARFGTIERIDIGHAERQAVIKFADWNSANAAYTSPAPIFENRFVKLFWHKNKSGKSKPTRIDVHSSIEPEVDAEALQTKQKEHEDRLDKRRIMDQRAAELAQQKAELQKRQDEQAAKILQLATESAPMDTSQAQSTTSSTSALEAQLAELKAKAASLGLTAEDLRGYSGSASRGAYRGRGGATRGYRGRGGSAPYISTRPRTLDLRPKTIRIKTTNIPASEMEAQIRATTEYEAVQRESSDTLCVTFKTRRDAEMFSSRHVGTEMSWVKDLQNGSANGIYNGSRDETMRNGSDDGKDRYDD